MGEAEDVLERLTTNTLRTRYMFDKHQTLLCQPIADMGQLASNHSATDTPGHGLMHTVVPSIILAQCSTQGTVPRFPLPRHFSVFLTSVFLHSKRHTIPPFR